MNNPMNDCSCNSLQDAVGVAAQRELNKRKSDAGGLTFFEKVTNNPAPLFVGLTLGGGTMFFINKIFKGKGKK